MIFRLLSLVLAVAGGVALAQFPEYAQQYTQRLGGAVNALTKVVADFDRSAKAEGLSRTQALAAMTGTEFVERRRADMERTISRSSTLAENLARLEPASAWARLGMAPRLMDREVAQQTWGSFKPAVPVNLEGLGFAGLGAALGLILAELLRLPFRRRRSRAPDPQTGGPA